MLDAYEHEGHRWQILPYAGPVAVCELRQGLQGICNAVVTHLCSYQPPGQPLRSWRRCTACATSWRVVHIITPRARGGTWPKTEHVREGEPPV